LAYLYLAVEIFNGLKGENVLEKKYFKVNRMPQSRCSKASWYTVYDDVCLTISADADRPAWRI